MELVRSDGEISGTLRKRESVQMPKRRFTDEQIAFALRQAEVGTNVGEICRKMGGSKSCFGKSNSAGEPECQRD